MKLSEDAMLDFPHCSRSNPAVPLGKAHFNRERKMCGFFQLSPRFAFLLILFQFTDRGDVRAIKEVEDLIIVAVTVLICGKGS